MTGGNVISLWVAEHFFWVFLIILLANMMQRRHQKRAGRKRFATLYIAIAALVFMAVGQFIVTSGGNDLMLLGALAGIILVMYHFRERTFPFRLYSRKDGRRLTWQEILYYDEDPAPDEPGEAGPRDTTAPHEDE